MNSKQQLALVIGLIAMVMIWIVPPWQHSDSAGAKQSMGYSPIWMPPVHTETKGADILGIVKFQVNESVQANTIDWSTLIGEGFVILLVTGGSIALLGMGNNSSQKTSSEVESKVTTPVA